DQVLRMLDRVLTDLAKQGKAKLIVFKEFNAVACDGMKGLLSDGYQQAESPAAHMFRADFKDFGDYCAALNSHYRNDIRRSQRKFEQAGLVPIHLRDTKDILRLYDDRLHHLYQAVVEKSAVRLEILPLSFFQELVKHFPRQVSFTAILKDNRVIAFNWGFHDQRMFYFLFCGMDYTEQTDNDLYFNLMFHQLDYALQCGPDWISFGQTADFFKSRLGSHPQPLYFFVKGVGPTVSRLVKHFSHLLFPKRAPVLQRSIFRTKRDPPPGQASKSKVVQARKSEQRVMEES
ncbi:MAG: GNAT family N-acetyltransferase, partial [Nitrospiraceae bacterium]